MAGQTERNNEIHLIGGETGTWFVFLLNSEIIGNFGIIVTFFLAEPFFCRTRDQTKDTSISGHERNTIKDAHAYNNETLQGTDRRNELCWKEET